MSLGGRFLHMSAAAVALAGASACAVGENGPGQPGGEGGSPPADLAGPTLPRPDVDGCNAAPSIAELALGGIFSHARLEDGSVWCWGMDCPGALNELSPSPRRVELPAAAVQVASGEQHACALLTDGSVWCWGLNVLGALAIEPKPGIPDLYGPLPVIDRNGDAAFGRPVLELACGTYFTCVRLEGGAVACWGDRAAFGELTEVDGKFLDAQPRPQRIPGLTGVTKLAPGRHHVCVVGQGDQPFCWGRIQHVDIAPPSNGAWPHIPEPVPLSGVAPVDDLKSGAASVCAIVGRGTICVDLGHETPLATIEPGPLLDFELTTSDYAFSLDCARRTDGTFFCVHPPERVPPAGAFTIENLGRVRMYDVGSGHACAVEETGCVKCWGEGFAAQGDYDGNLGEEIQVPSYTYANAVDWPADP